MELSTYKQETIQFCWQLTSYCNYDCTYCNAKSTMNSTDDIDSLYRTVLHRLKNLDAKFEMIIVGGEPTLHKDIDIIIKELLRLPNCTYVGLTTNLSKPKEFFEHYTDTKFQLIASYHPQYKGEYTNKLIYLNNKIRVVSHIVPSVDNSISKILDKNNIDYEYIFLNDTNTWEVQEVNKYNIELQYIKDNNLNKFKGLLCYNKMYYINTTGIISRQCSGDVSKMVLKADELNKPMVCPNEFCEINSTTMNILKVENV